MGSSIPHNIIPNGYELLEILHEGKNTLVYRARRLKEKTSVVIKTTPPQMALRFSDHLAFRNQFTIGQTLNHPGIIQILALEPCHQTYALVMEDVQWTPLSEMLQSSISLKDGLTIALQLADILHYLGQQRVLHKDIKPGNILLHPQTLQVKLIDFGIASLLPKETQEIKNPNALEGTLAYIAPEQTGRMNRGIDFRSDFYSLGVTLFELFAGQLPFQADEPVVWLHCHIAQIPPSLTEFGVPGAVANLVAKLLAKNAEDRYQSALGLKHDLELCLTQVTAGEEIEPFKLGLRDVCDRFLIPEKLYGRKAEVKTLLDAFDRVAQGSSELMLVAGFSGIGKTAVINEVHKPITQKKGYFIKGKFDQFNRNIPFSAFVQAFRSLMGQLLGESDSDLAHWKTRVLEVVGESGQVLIDVIPELEHIIGKQPTVPELSGTVAQNRFNLLVGQFTQVFSTQDHPLVIFLDDLQWADSASLNLLNLLMGKSKTDYLLVLGAYRDNEVFSAHPLMLQLDELKQQGSSFQTLALASLSQNDINHLVADTLLCAPDIALPLSELVYQKTQGNPFFTTQFLQGLHSDQQITFDTEARYWQCDLTQVQQLALTDDVVIFMVGRLQTLPASTQEVLKIAACIGNQFDLDTLALVCEDNKEQIATDLWPALNDGLILSQSEDYKFFSNNNNDTDIGIKQDITISYHFMHDRFQQAADALIPEEDKKEYHLKIGQLLYKKRIEQDQKVSIFNIVNSLNQGINLIDDPCQRQQLAQLNLEAGQKAKASIAYTEAVSYFESGIKLLSDQGWKTQYVLILSLYSELVDVHYLRGDFEAVETISSSALEHVSVIADTLPIYIAQIASDQAQGKMLSGLELSFKVLKSLGIQMSTEISNDTIQKKLSQTLSEFQSRTIDEFIALPQTSDPQLLRTQDLLTLMVGYAYKSKPELLPIIICKQISLLLQHGNIPASASIYALFAMLLCGFQKFESGYFAGEVALAVMEAFPTKQFEMRVRNLIYAYVTPWKGLLKDCIPPLKNGFSIGIESGDIEYTAYGIQHYVQFLFFSGVNLATIDQENQTYSKVLETYRQDGILWSLQIFHQTALNLINLSEKPWELEGTIFRESECLQNWQENNFDVLIAALYINKLVVSYLFGKPLLGIGFAETANKSNSGLTGEFQISYLYYFRALCCLAILNQGTAEERTHILSQVDNDIKKLDLFSHHAPMNFKHQVDLVKAERHRVLDQKLEAIDAYELAIAGAKENGYVQEEALGNELAAKFYLDWGKDKSATAYIQEAYGCYARWGAKAKTDDLEQRYTDLLQPILQPRSQSLNPLATLASLVDTNLSIHSSATSNRTNLNISLDFAALLAGAQALSESLNLSELLEKLTQMILQNSGADSLVLLLPETDDSWHIRATAIPETTQLTNEPLVGSSNLPVQLIQYVQHTQEVLVVDDLDTDLPILDDYLQQHQPCSVLCLPIRYQGNLSGLLYLQNQSTAGVFTCDRITVLNFLCSQAAIALENARLFSKRLDIEAELQQLNAQLDQRVKERTQELSETLETLKSAQVNLIEAEKMAALGTLVAGVAHEINTPIGTSITVASTLADESEQFLQAAENGQLRRSTLNQYLEVVRQCTQLLNSNLSRAGDLIQSFKQVAIDQSHQELRTFNLKAYVEEVVTSLQPQVKHSGHQLRVSGDEWITLIHDPGVVAQLITNLVTNSIKHAYAEGETGQLQIQIKQQDQRAFMTYSDDGCGIPPANLSKVYEPFFTTARHRGGTGLGLNIVYNIVTQSLQGTIQIDSQVGQGTTFTIAIPYKPDLKAR